MQGEKEDIEKRAGRSIAACIKEPSNLVPQSLHIRASDVQIDQLIS